MKSDDLAGKWFISSQISEEFHQYGKFISAVEVINGKIYCRRCGSYLEKSWSLPNGNHYCRRCIVFGRISTKDQLLYFQQKIYPKVQSLKWKGQLTTNQQVISNALLENLDEKHPILVHAVTGAGKTEMIYPLVSKFLDEGLSVCIASPRVDVCIELERRLSVDFICPVNLLYANSDKKMDSPLTIATTHQLLKFYRAFDLLIIDEVDSFPYVDNPILYHASSNAIKKDGYSVILTATSTDELDKKIQKGLIKRVSLAKRFHGNPLVIPKMVWLSQLNDRIKKKRLPRKLIKLIENQLKTDFPLLIFYPTIKEGEEFVAILKAYFKNIAIGFVSSLSDDREMKVTDFRNKKIRILVSTTILERGVTFPCVDVIVLYANHPLFNRSSLVQISGRVGRAKERPTGDLLFCHDGLTKAMVRAKKEILKMNQEAGF